MHFALYRQPAWAPVWRGGRLPRKLKKRFYHHGFYHEPTGFRDGYTYPGHPKYEPPPPLDPNAEIITITDVSWVDVHMGKRVGGRWKPRHIWSEIRRAW